MRENPISIPRVNAGESVRADHINAIRDCLITLRARTNVQLGPGMLGGQDSGGIYLESRGGFGGTGAGTQRLWGLLPLTTTTVKIRCATIGGLLPVNHSVSFTIPEDLTPYFIIAKGTISEGSISSVSLQVSTTPADLNVSRVNLGTPPNSFADLIGIGSRFSCRWSYLGNVSMTIEEAFRKVKSSGAIPYDYYWQISFDG